MFYFTAWLYRCIFETFLNLTICLKNYCEHTHPMHRSHELIAARVHQIISATGLGHQHFGHGFALPLPLWGEIEEINWWKIVNHGGDLHVAHDHYMILHFRKSKPNFIKKHNRKIQLLFFFYLSHDSHVLCYLSHDSYVPFYLSQDSSVPFYLSQDSYVPFYL